LKISTESVYIITFSYSAHTCTICHYCSARWQVYDRTATKT